ncbi:MAG: hypothetical protein ACJASZ_001552 [Yoonia sp.]
MSDLHEGVFDYLDGTDVIHHRQIKADIGQLTFWFSSQKFARTCANAVHWTTPQSGRGRRKAVAFLYLDENDCIAVAGNKIDLARFTAPPLRGNTVVAARVVLRNNLFCSKPRMTPPQIPSFIVSQA